jgi:hypothetical protein
MSQLLWWSKGQEQWRNKKEHKRIFRVVQAAGV